MVKKGRWIIVVSGTPCVGKSAVSAFLASKLGAVHVNLGELVVKQGLFSRKDERRGSLVADLKKVKRYVKKIVSQTNVGVVVDGHYAVDVVPAEDVWLVFVLRRDPKELRLLMEARGWSGRKLWENLACEILDVCLSDAVRRVGVGRICEIDVSGKNVEDVVDEILQILERKKKCRVGVVDWLARLELEGRLDEFLREF